MRKFIVDLGKARGRGTHPGLLLQRYLVKRSDDPEERPEERRAHLDAVLEAAHSQALHALYSEAHARWTQSCSSARAHRSQQLRTAGRLLIGLGSENVLEAGLRLHHTYGTPVIPGSALKGLASHYCHEEWGQSLNEAAPEAQRSFRRGKQYHQVLFGDTDDGGLITYHDAWLVPEALSGGALRLDVMTPHHRKWQLNEAPPTDFDSPVPVSFLSVAGTFDIHLTWAGPVSTPSIQAEAWTALAMRLLQESLENWGIGAKTRSGYGRLVPADRETIRARPSVAQLKVTAPFASGVLPKAGEGVEAQLLEERTKKGGWRALHPPSGLSGPIHNTAQVPSDKRAGDTVQLIVKSANARELAFFYPTVAAQEPAPTRKPGS